MWIPEDPSRFTHKFKYREFGRFIPPDDKHPKGHLGRWRTKDKPPQPILFSLEEIETRSAQYDHTGIYTSVWHFSERDIRKAQMLGNLYFDLDSADTQETMNEAKIVYNHLLQYIPESALNLYFSGRKGYHIEAEAVALGIGPSADLADIYRFIANDIKETYDLKTLDFQVYDIRRMWRLPGTKHQLTGLYKTLLDPAMLDGDPQVIQDYCKELRSTEITPQSWSSQANEWFREYTYKKEEQKMSSEDMVQRFLKHGTGIVRDANTEREFDPVRLFEGCPAIMRLWNKAEKERHLEHNERLFLCSILSYTDESIWYLHQILQNSRDYNYEKTQAHIDDWVKRREYNIGGRPFSCSKANALGVGCGSCDLEPKEKYERVGDRMVPTGEQALASPIRFAYHTKKKEVV